MHQLLLAELLDNLLRECYNSVDFLAIDMCAVLYEEARLAEVRHCVFVLQNRITFAQETILSTDLLAELVEELVQRYRPVLGLRFVHSENGAEVLHEITVLVQLIIVVADRHVGIIVGRSCKTTSDNLTKGRQHIPLRSPFASGLFVMSSRCFRVIVIL